MLDPGPITEVIVNSVEQAPTEPRPAMPIEPLEHRVLRLEDAVAFLQDTRKLEERLAERITRRLRRNSTQFPDVPSVVVDAEQSRLTGPAPPSITDQLLSPAKGRLLRGPWLIWDTYAELRDSVRMFFDPRYRPTRTGRFMPLLLGVLILTSWIWIPGVSILPFMMGCVVVKVVDLLLAFTAFMVLTREARRYREVIAANPITPRS